MANNALDALDATTVRQLIAAANHDVVVLERIARGGGATCWYVLRNPSELDDLASRLSPGSAVTFYFDGRIRHVRYGPRFHELVMKIIEESGDAVVGLPGVDEISLAMESVAGPNDVAEFEETLGSDSAVYIGAFPAREDDGSNAVMVIIPDADGVVRLHPY